MGKSRALLSGHVGRLDGPIRRFISPDDPLADRLKPFVFLDHPAGAIPEGFGFGFHPHSGIATLTYQLDADVSYQDTGGLNGRLRARRLEGPLVLGASDAEEGISMFGHVALLGVLVVCFILNETHD